MTSFATAGNHFPPDVTIPSTISRPSVAATLHSRAKRVKHGLIILYNKPNGHRLLRSLSATQTLLGPLIQQHVTRLVTRKRAAAIGSARGNQRAVNLHLYMHASRRRSRPSNGYFCSREQPWLATTKIGHWTDRSDASRTAKEKLSAKKCIAAAAMNGENEA